MSALRNISRFLALEGNIRVLALQSLVSQLGFGMMYVVWQPYILSRGMSVVDLGLIQSLINLSTAAGLFIWGSLSDRIGRKPVMIVANACRLLSMVALVASGNFIFLLIFAFFIGFSALFMQANPARSAMITESVDPRNRATAYGTLMAISQITNMVTSSAGGYIALVSGYYPIFYACIAGDIIGIALMTLYIKETHKPSKETRRISAGELVKKYLIPERKILPMYVIMSTMGFGYGIGYSLFYGALVDNFGYTTLQLGIFNTVFSLTWGLSSIPLGKLADRVGRKPMLLASCTCSLITVLGFIFFHSFEAFLLFNVVSAIDPSFWISSWVSLVSEKVSPTERSTALGKLDAYSRFAGIPAAYIAGIVYTNYGFNGPLLVFLGFVLTWFIMVWKLDTTPAKAQ